MVSDSSALLRSSMQQVSVPADMYPRSYTQGAHNLRPRPSLQD